MEQRDHAVAVPEVHCSLPSCRTLDFLPLKCPHCSLEFCRQHANPANHSCPADPALQQISSEEAARPHDPGRVEVRDFLPDPNRHRTGHVNPAGGGASRMDPAKAETKARQGAALDKLRASFAAARTGSDAKGTASDASRTASGAAKSRPVNPALELMRLKQRAVPADPKHEKRPGDVPPPDRLYLTAAFVDSDGSRRPEDKAVWLSKSVSAGKALDLLADLFKVPNYNNAPCNPDQRLSLALDQTPLAAIQLSAPIRGQVPDGSRILLVRGATDT